MNYFSTNHQSPSASLPEVITRGLAPDGGLYLPERIDPLPVSFFNQLSSMTLSDLVRRLACHFLGSDISRDEVIYKIAEETFNFPIPLVNVHDRLYALELFHGPTFAFKDVGARFMARLLRYVVNDSQREINVLAATSGDTGSAVATGFYQVPGVRVFVLYPKGKVSELQEKQFTTLHENITALEVDGTFDDCQRMVKQAFADADLNSAMCLTSANSINWGRLLPQAFYYYWGVAQMQRERGDADIVCAVPSGNFGNLCSALIAKRSGLPIRHFIAATNINTVVPDYLKTGLFKPQQSKATIANAMDVGNPSNFARILELYGGSHTAICADIEGFSCNDAEISDTIRDVKARYGYLLDPHGAIAYRALEQYLTDNPQMCGFFIETAHPAKFRDAVEPIIGETVPLPPRLARIAEGTKETVEMSNLFNDFKSFLLNFK